MSNDFHFNIPIDPIKPKKNLDKTLKNAQTHIDKAIHQQRKDWPEYMVLKVYNIYSDNTFDLITPDEEHLFERVSAIDPRAKDFYQRGKAVTVRFNNVNGGRPYIKFGYGFMSTPVDISIDQPTYGAIRWSQMEGTPEGFTSRWTINDFITTMKVPQWDVGAPPPPILLTSAPTTNIPILDTGSPTEVGAFSPIYGFVMFPNTNKQQCIVHAYLEYNSETNKDYIVVRCYNMVDPSKNWSSSVLTRDYIFSDWDQTSMYKAEPNQKRMAYNKNDHQIILLGPSYSTTPYYDVCLLDAETGVSSTASLGSTKIPNNISFGKDSILSAWWISTKVVVPLVNIPTTSTPNNMIWVSTPTGATDSSTITEDGLNLWKKNKLTSGLSPVYSFTLLVNKHIIAESSSNLVVSCSPMNKYRWPYSSKADAYAYAVLSGSGMDLSLVEHRMTLYSGVGTVPESGYFRDIWTTPENPATEISATSMNKYKYHMSTSLDIYIISPTGYELYHDTITSYSTNLIKDEGTFEYTSTSIPFVNGTTTSGTSFDVVSGYHVETLDPNPETYLHYDVMIEDYTTITPGNIYTETYLGYVDDQSQHIYNTRVPITYNSDGLTGTIDPTEDVLDWEDPTPIAYWAYGEGFHYHKEHGIIPSPDPRPEIINSSGTENLGFEMDSGTDIHFPVLSVLQGLPCTFPMPIRNDKVGWNARLFTPTDTSLPGGTPVPYNATGVFDNDGNYYIAYAVPEVWIRGCADVDRHFYLSSINYIPYAIANLGRSSYYKDLTAYRRVSPLTGEVSESALPYPTNYYYITGFEVYHGKGAYQTQTVTYGMCPVSETVYQTYLRKISYASIGTSILGDPLPGTYTLAWDTNISHSFISPADTEGDFVSRPDARGTPITIGTPPFEVTYLPPKWFPLVSMPRPTLEQIWSITPVKAKYSPRNLLILIHDRRVDENINIESVPHLYILNADTGSIITNVDISYYSGVPIDSGGLYQYNYYYHEEDTISEAVTGRGGPEIIINHNDAGNSVAIVKVWRQDRTTLEKSIILTTLFFTGDSLSVSTITIQAGLTGANGWVPYNTLKSLGSFKNCAFSDVMYFFDLASNTLKDMSQDTSFIIT